MLALVPVETEQNSGQTSPLQVSARLTFKLIYRISLASLFFSVRQHHCFTLKIPCMGDPCSLYKKKSTLFSKLTLSPYTGLYRPPWAPPFSAQNRLPRVPLLPASNGLNDDLDRRSPSPNKLSFSHLHTKR